MVGEGEGISFWPLMEPWSGIYIGLVACAALLAGAIGRSGWLGSSLSGLVGFREGRRVAIAILFWLCRSPPVRNLLQWLSQLLLFELEFGFLHLECHFPELELEPLLPFEEL